MDADASARCSLAQRGPSRVWRLPSEPDRVLISVNPKAGRTESRPAADRLADLLCAQGLRPEIVDDLNAMAD